MFDCDCIIKDIRDQLKQYIQKSKLQSLICGVSGGIDSTLTCVLAKPVCDALNIPLKGYSLPIIQNDATLALSLEVGSAFCSNFLVEDLYSIYNDTVDGIGIDIDTSHYDEKIRLGNIQARLRMIYLYDQAKKYNGLVLSTDNYTEYLLGFYTLHGDVGDLGMIQNLWKTECYQIAKYLLNQCHELCYGLSDIYFLQKQALFRSIHVIPTDGLGITKNDFEQIGANSYKEIDQLLQQYIAGDRTQIDHPVIQRYLASQYKRNNPTNIKILR